MFWYDTPARVKPVPELEWFEQLKTSFDDSRVLSGEPGKSVVEARRNGDDWWVGAITNNDASQQSVNLSFLDNGKTYLTSVYTDDDNVSTATHVRCSYVLVNSKKVMKFNLKPRGGAAIHLVPVDRTMMKKYKKYSGKVL